MIVFFFFIWFLLKITFWLFFWLFFLHFLIYVFWGFYEDYWLMSEYLYLQENIDDWDINLDDVTETTPFLMWELNVSNISDDFWNFFDDAFYPWDNYLYPEFRYFFIFAEFNKDIWI